MAEQTDLNLNVFVERLINDEDEAWLFLKERVEEFLKKDKKFNEILHRTSHPHDEFVDELFKHLKEDNNHRLKGCKEPEAFWGWLYPVELTVLTKLTNSKEETRDPDVIGTALDSTRKAKENFERQVRQQDALERLRITRKSFVKLWKEDPKSAFIMFAKFELEIPSSDVGNLLGITANYVDVMVNRARATLRAEEAKLL